MPVGRLIIKNIPAIDADGLTVAGAELRWFQAGTTTPKPVYSDVGLTTPHSYPILADINGQFPVMYAEVSTGAVPNLFRGTVYHPNGTMLPGGSIDNVEASVSVVNIPNFDPGVTVTAFGETWLSLTTIEEGRDELLALDRDLTEVTADAAQGADFLDAISANADNILVDLPGALTIPASNHLKSFVTPEDFGAVGDGTTDDWQALVDLADYINARGGGRVVFGRGKTYYIAQIDPGDNTKNLPYTDCDGLVFDLNGSTISVNGNYHRATTDGMRSVIPFWLVGCRNVVFMDGTIDQNVQDTTRAGGVTEAFAHCIALAGCRNVKFLNITAKGSTADGLNLQVDGRSTPYTSCYNVSAENCLFEENSRLGLSVNGMVGLRASNCSFSNNGNVAGTYGNTAPAAGVDVEPDYLPGTTAGTQDSKATDIVFDTCRFDNNFGGPFIASNPNSTESVTLINCSGIGDPTSGAEISTSLVAAVGCFKVIGGRWLNISLAPALTFIEATAAAMTGGCWGATFVGDIPQFRGVSIGGFTAGPNFIIQGNAFRFTSTSASTIMPGAPQMPISGTGVRFEGNEIWVSEDLYSGAVASNPFASISGAMARNNRWNTDMTSGAQMFIVDYNEGASQADAAGEKFVNRFSVLSSLAVRGYGNDTFGIGVLRLGLASVARNITYAASIPLSGTYQQGDFTFQTAAGPGNKVGWYTTTGGSPGTQKPAAEIDA